MIKHNLPLVTPQDIEAVSNTVSSGWIAHGSEVKGLENDFISFMGGGRSCACSSGSAALFLALKGLSISEGKRVAVPTYACSALLNAVNMAGAEPVICDVNPETFCIEPESIPDVDCTIAVHTYGKEAEIEKIKQKSGVVIEDCCQSLGSKWDGKPVGIKGDAAIFSFYATKIVTCGHGGLVWDSSGGVADWAQDYRNFDSRSSYKPRFNFHMSDIQASMVRSQFKRIEAIRERRREIAAKYLEAIDGKISVQSGIRDSGRMIYRFVLLFESQMQRDILKKKFEKSRIQTLIPVEKFELLHRYHSLPASDFPNAERLADSTLSIPIYPSLTDKQVDLVCQALNRELL